MRSGPRPLTPRQGQEVTTMYEPLPVSVFFLEAAGAHWVSLLIGISLCALVVLAISVRLIRS